MTVTNPFDGSGYQLKDNIDFAKLEEMNGECQSSKIYDRWVKNLDVSAEMKAIMIKLNETVLVVGKVVVKIGKFLLNIIMEIAKQFPSTIMGLVIGFVLGLMFSSIPLIGWLLGPIVLPLFVVLGGVLGFVNDMEHKISNQTTIGEIRKMVDERLSKFSASSFA